MDVKVNDQGATFRADIEECIALDASVRMFVHTATGPHAAQVRGVMGEGFDDILAAAERCKASLSATLALAGVRFTPVDASH